MSAARPLLLALSLLSAPALAEDEATTWQEQSELDVELHGDVKTFFVASVPNQWFGLADDAQPFLDLAEMTEEEALEAYGLSTDPTAQGAVSARLTFAAVYNDNWRLDTHLALNVGNAAGASPLPGASTGVGLTAPEVLKLTYTPDLGSGMVFQGRVDRLVLSAKLPHVDVALGRQPISFGTGYFFTPMDLVNPFHPATIDTEYKPGVDALRIDAYAGVSSKMTLAVAYAGDDVLIGEEADTDDDIVEDLVLAASGQATVGVSDILGFAGLVHGEPVFGLGTISAIGPIGVHAEATLTLPKDDDVFVRGVAGADWRPGQTTTLMGEFYVQSFGAIEPADYLDITSNPRFLRGELWQMGRYYAALSVSQEITSLIMGNVAVIGNLTDPSGLVVAGLSWSVADNAALGAGAYIGAGKKPELVDLSLDMSSGTPSIAMPTDDVLAESVQSEFGLYPKSFYLQMKTYF
ncbi:MAG: hypothetical protein KC912_21335 [Proteobacteria bacterium]|nr:hypothetical protein [Pseudomonadota bacterium]